MEFVTYEQKGAYAVITISREKALNALNSQVLDELDKTLDGVNLDEVRCLILTGAGSKSFVAGADIGEMSTLTKAEGEAFGKKGNDVFRKLETFPIPVIAAVNGYALGGGNEIAMACDIRIASTKAIFGQPEVNLGIMPCFGGTQRLTRLVGAGIAKELMFTARNVTAEEAYRIGLVNKVVEPAELLDAAKEMMNVILTKSPLGVAACKVAANKGGDLSIADGLNLEADLNGLLFSTADKNEGVGAFIEKRAAKFTGK